MIDEDFPPETAAFLKQEIEMSKGRCFYSPILKKVFYLCVNEAMNAYMFFQIAEMEKHKWRESEKAGRDLGEQVSIDWDRRYAPNFASFWKRTHSFTPVLKEPILECVGMSACGNDIY